MFRDMRPEHRHVTSQSFVTLLLRPDRVCVELWFVVVGVTITNRQNPDRIDVRLEVTWPSLDWSQTTLKGFDDGKSGSTHSHFENPSKKRQCPKACPLLQ